MLVTYNHPPVMGTIVVAGLAVSDAKISPSEEDEEIQEQDRYITIADIPSITKNQLLKNTQKLRRFGPFMRLWIHILHHLSRLAQLLHGRQLNTIDGDDLPWAINQ